jgi:hypothetical protein
MRGAGLTCAGAPSGFEALDHGSAQDVQSGVPVHENIGSCTNQEGSLSVRGEVRTINSPMASSDQQRLSRLCGFYV